jgi:dihydropteroate synthase
VKDSAICRKHTLNLGGKILSLHTPIVMGILNLTPDSFYDGGVLSSEKAWITQATKMFSEGATLLDIGGYSSRPGATDISVKEELQRVVPVIKSILKEFPDALLSIDTFRSEVAKQAIDAGALMVNDISGGELDGNMFKIVAQRKIPYILMHMQGMPQNMANSTQYTDIFPELMDYFQKKLHKLLTLGVVDVIIDLGFGFAKTLGQNFGLLGNLQAFQILERPVLVGLSRKSMIYKTLGVTANEALNGTTALHMVALQNGASILRAHDVKEAVEAIKLSETLLNYEQKGLY